MRKRGFTLTEIMVALIVAVVLASMAFPRLMTFVDKVKSQEARQVLLLVFSEQKLYYKLNNVYADDISKLDIEFTTIKNFKSLDIQNGTSTITGSLGITRPYLAALTSMNDLYKLYVLEDGIIVCTPDGAGSACQRMGFPLF